MTEYLLTPPSTTESFGQYDRISDPLWRWMRADVALSLVKIDGIWQTARLSSYPDLDVLEGYYQGGYTYSISLETAEELAADGFLDNISAVESDPDPDPEPEPEPTPIWSLASATVSPETVYVTSETADYGIDGVFSVEFWVTEAGPGLSGAEIRLSTNGVGGELFLIDTGVTGYDPGTERATLFNTDNDDFQIVTDAGADDGGSHYVVCRSQANVVDLWVDNVARGGFPWTGTFHNITTIRVINNGSGGSSELTKINVYNEAISESVMTTHFEEGP